MREYINLKDIVALNIKAGDSLPCSYCHLPITILPNRKNRIDCEDGDMLMSYHLWCYDMVVMEKVMSSTQKLMIKLLREYGMI